MLMEERRQGRREGDVDEGENERRLEGDVGEGKTGY